LVGRLFIAFYCSDLLRASQTAEVIARAIDRPPEATRSLREIFLGEWEGLTTEEIARRFPVAWAEWVKEPDWDLVPGGESAERFDARIAAAIDLILGRHPHGDVLVVTHGGVIQVALHRIVGRPSRGLFPFRIQNASISLIERRNARMVIGGVNDIAHLERALVTDVGAG
jgi:broad specificity phosphatase PhoE